MNQPGCYRDVKDTTCTAQFRILDPDNRRWRIWRTVTSWRGPLLRGLAFQHGVFV
ncbi:MAG: hypothetical protein ACLRS8_18050 [Parabacteroides merdae]